MALGKKGKRSEVHNLPHKINVAKRYDLHLAYLSARTRVRMMLHPLPPRKYLEAIDENAVKEIRQRFYQSYEPSTPVTSKVGLKYLNAQKYLPVNVRRAQELELDSLPPQRILDLGSGVGYFLFVCQQLGHECLGLDTDDVPAYEAMMKLLGVPRVTSRIEPFVPLPDLGARFDLVTAHQILFNRSKPSGHWKLAEWEFFLDDLRSHLKPNGRILLRFNPERKDCYITEELSDFFRSYGAQVRRTTVRFDFKSR